MKYNVRDKKGRFVKQDNSFVRDVMFIIGVMGVMLLIATFLQELQ